MNNMNNMNKQQQQQQRQQHQPVATAATSAPEPADTFSDAEWQDFIALRASYQQGHDLLSAREQAHLRFLRWLIETGRLVP